MWKLGNAIGYEGAHKEACMHRIAPSRRDSGVLVSGCISHHWIIKIIGPVLQRGNVDSDVGEA